MLECRGASESEAAGALGEAITQSVRHYEARVALRTRQLQDDGKRRIALSSGVEDVVWYINSMAEEAKFGIH